MPIYNVTLVLPVEADTMEEAALSFAGTIANDQDWGVTIDNTETGETDFLDIELLRDEELADEFEQIDPNT